MSKVKNYLSLIKFSHTIFAMPFALIGFFLGFKSFSDTSYNNGQWNLNKEISLKWDLEQGVLPFSEDSLIAKIAMGEADVYTVVKYFLFVILCMIFARSAAMAFNRYLDRRIDAKNPRTAIREIPSGVISAKNALLFTRGFLCLVHCYLFLYKPTLFLFITSCISSCAGI